MRAISMREFVHRVDAGDRIVSADENWVAFAAENGLPSLTAEAVRGKVLWDFISERTTREFYVILAQKARKSGKMISVPFRCDGPECRRFMRMVILPVRDDGLEFRSVLVREEARRRAALFDPQAPRSDELIPVCAWCKKVKAWDWMEVEQAVEELRLFEETRLPAITHGICPECRAALELKLAEE
jgi:hypothetical protein